MLFSSRALAESTCSRTATINYQDVLVDLNTTSKGEGLRHYLEKDEEALKYLNTYQEGTKPKILNAALGTAGSLLILTGLLSTKSDSGKRSLLITGASVLAMNFLVAKTLSHQNEKNLHRAIDEYNLRNLPKIYYNPSNSGTKRKSEAGIVLNFSKDF